MMPEETAGRQTGQRPLILIAPATSRGAPGLGPSNPLNRAVAADFPNRFKSARRWHDFLCKRIFQIQSPRLIAHRSFENMPQCAQITVQVSLCGSAVLWMKLCGLQEPRLYVSSA